MQPHVLAPLHPDPILRQIDPKPHSAIGASRREDQHATLPMLDPSRKRAKLTKDHKRMLPVSSRGKALVSSELTVTPVASLPRPDKR